MIWSIDGNAWDYPCRIEREAEMTASEISGMMLDKSYFNDVMGTWRKYDLTLAVPVGAESEYARIYELLTEPVDGHVFVLPYNNSTITITARVASVQDVWVRLPGNQNFWRGTQFTIVANHPSKTKELETVVERGRTPLPDTASMTVQDGATFTYSAEDGWTVVQLDDIIDEVLF